MPSELCKGQLVLADGHYFKGEFLKAEEIYDKITNVFLKGHSFNDYLKCQMRKVRILLEMNRREELKLIEDGIKFQIESQQLESSSGLYYSLGVCSFYRGDVESSGELFYKALNQAMVNGNEKDIGYGLIGQAIIDFYKGESLESLKKLKRLNFIIESLDFYELSLSANLLETMIWIEEKKFNEAHKSNWQAFQKLKLLGGSYLRSYLHLNFAKIYMNFKSSESVASYHLNKAKLNCNPELHARVLANIKEFEDEIHVN